MNKTSINMRLVGAAIGGIAGGLFAYFAMDWLNPSSGPVPVIGFLAATGAFLGNVIALNVELHRSSRERKPR